MYKDLKWIRLVPDNVGKGGMKTGIHSFQVVSVNDTRKVVGYHVWQGAWKLDDGHLAYTPQTPGASFVNWGIHGYVYPNLVDISAVPSVTLLGHEQHAGQVCYYDYTHGTVRNSHGSGVPVPATFLNIGGRCFIVDGMREGFIADDRTPAIHAQPNQNLGIADPPAGINLSAGISFDADVYAHLASPFLTTPNPDSQVGTIVIAETISPIVLNPGWPYYVGSLANPNPPIANAVTSNTTPLEPGGTISCVKGSSLITLSGASWGSLWRECGLEITFAGYSFLIAETYENTGGSNVAYDINGNGVTLSGGAGVYPGRLRWADRDECPVQDHGLPS